MISPYLPVLLMLAAAIATAVGMCVVSGLVGPRRKSSSKEDPYECGVPPVGDTLARSTIKYYLIGALFILFDVEVLFLFAWAVVFKGLGMFAFIEILAFLVIVLAGYVYALKEGALEWL